MILTPNVDRVKIEFKLTFVADVTMPSWFAGAASSFGIIFVSNIIAFIFVADITIPSWFAGAASSFGVIFVSIKTTYLIAFKVLQEKGEKAILISVTF